MAVLSEVDRAAVSLDYQRNYAPGESVACTRPQIRAAIDAADDWLELNASSFNLALPLAARQNLTARQKARLLVWVIRRRFEVT